MTETIIYLDDNKSMLYTIGVFGLECLIVFGFLFCCGCLCFCGNLTNLTKSNRSDTHLKFKITKYQDINLSDKVVFKLNVPPTNPANPTLSIANLNSNNLNYQQNEHQQNENIDESSIMVQHMMSNNSVSISSNSNDSDKVSVISVAKTETHNSTDLEYQTKITTNINTLIKNKTNIINNNINNTNNTNNVNNQNQNMQKSFKNIINWITCGFLYKKENNNVPTNVVNDDIENKKKRYLLYKFNNLDSGDSSFDSSKYFKSDPYADLKDFTNVISDVYNPSDIEILLHISSPGGYAYKFEEIYLHINRLKNKGFIITAVIDNFCASGGYMLASACNKIVASPYAQIGSVGVICTAYNWYDLSQKLGITQKTFKSGSDKEGFPTGDPITQEDIDRMQNRLNDTLQIFKEMVQTSRNLNDVEMEEILTAKVWYGKEAFNKKLVDVVSFSKDYFENLLSHGDIYLVTPQSQKKSLIDDFTKYTTITDSIENLIIMITNIGQNFSTSNLFKLE